MKKTMFLTAALSALFCISLAGCTIEISDDTVSAAADAASKVLEDAVISIDGQPVGVSVGEDGNINVQIQPVETVTVPATTSAVTTETAATVTATESAPEVTTAATATILTEAEMRSVAEKLIPEYCGIAECMQLGWVQTDPSQSRPSGMVSDYYLVTDPELQSLADIPVVIAKTLTGEEYTKQVNAVLDQGLPYPVYAEFDGKLYALDGACGSFYGSSEWLSYRFSNVTTDSFTVTGVLRHFEQFDYEQNFDIVRTENGFRISRASEAVPK